MLWSDQAPGLLDHPWTSVAFAAMTYSELRLWLTPSKLNSYFTFINKQDPLC